MPLLPTLYPGLQSKPIPEYGRWPCPPRARQTPSMFSMYRKQRGPGRIVSHAGCPSLCPHGLQIPDGLGASDAESHRNPGFQAAQASSFCAPQEASAVPPPIQTTAMHKKASFTRTVMYFDVLNTDCPSEIPLRVVSSGSQTLGDLVWGRIPICGLVLLVGASELPGETPDFVDFSQSELP